MPTVSSKNLVYTPRAHGYFHPPGSTDIRITQPPTVFKLPALHRTVSWQLSFVPFACSSYRMLVNVGRSLETRLYWLLGLSKSTRCHFYSTLKTSSCTLGLIQYWTVWMRVSVHLLHGTVYLDFIQLSLFHSLWNKISAHIIIGKSLSWTLSTRLRGLRRAREWGWLTVAGSTVAWVIAWAREYLMA